MSETKEYKNIAESNFRLIGIKMEPCSANKEIPYVKRMQKSLFGVNSWFYFYKGFSFADDLKSCSVDKNAFKDAQIFNTEHQTVSISAIVGKNGTGKSTIVEMMIRVLNNLSAAILSEEEVYLSAAHLHFIDYVYASLAVYVDKSIKIITCRGRNITITELQALSGVKYVYTDKVDVLKVGTSFSPDRPILEEDIDEVLRDELSNLFYTAVYNYSLYAFNYRDYASEITPKKRLGTLDSWLTSTEEDKYWLKGVFHKNDGYQTPIVLNPMREDGMLNVVKENKLAKDRLFSLLFYQDESGNYPFRIINEKLEIVGLNLKKELNKTYDKEFVLKSLGIDDDNYIAVNYKNKYDLILNYWADEYSFNVNIASTNDVETCNYIVYKTIKISKKYKKYSNLYSWLDDPNENIDSVELYLDQIKADKSHITLKLRRALNFLRHFQDTYEGYELGRKNLSELCEEYDQIQELSAVFSEDGTILDFTTKEELLPPPTINYDFDIVPIDKIKKNNGTINYDENDIIPFEGLSSGERQIAYTISNVMYHLVNIDSVWDDFNTDHPDHANEFKYRYVNLLFDELELYFHPELQRLFVSYILNAIASASLSHIQGINILLVTHSPFVISDLPDSNVLFLTNDNEPSIGKTFGANIYEMLNDHFFMGQPIGEKAVSELKEIIDLYNYGNKPQDYSKNKNRYRYVASIIGDQYLKKEIERMLDEMDRLYAGEDNLEEELKKYEQMVKELKFKLGHE